MQYLAYKGIAGVWLDLMRRQGLDVFYIAEGDATFDERTVCEKAHEEGRVLLTADEALGERLLREKLLRTGIVVFKPGKLSELAAAKLLTDTLRNRAADLSGNYGVLAKNGLKIKPLNLA